MTVSDVDKILSFFLTLKIRTVVSMDAPLMRLGCFTGSLVVFWQIKHSSQLIGAMLQQHEQPTIGKQFKWCNGDDISSGKEDEQIQ